MPSRKKMAIAAAVAVFSASALAGCVPTASTGAGGGGGGGDNTLDVWYLSGHTTVPAAVDRFEEANPDIKVNLTEIPNDQFKTKIRVALGTANGPDIFHTWGGATLAENAASDLVVPIDDVVEDNGLADAINPAILDLGKVDGVQYALPLAIEASMTWYNTEIFDKLSLKPPTTWDEFLDVIAATKEAGYTPIAMANATQWPGAQWWSELVALSCGPDFWATIGTDSPKFKYNDDCVVAANEKIVELVDAGAFNEGLNGLDYDSGESRQLFWSEKAAMNHMGNWTVSSAVEEAPDMLKKMDFFTVPAWDGAAGTSDMMTGGISPAFAISSSTPNVEAAKELVSFMVNEDAAVDVAASGRVPVYNGVEVTDPLVQKVADSISNAPAIATWAEQLLAPELATVMMEQVQSLFGGDTTPQAAADAMQSTFEKLQG